VRFQVLMAMSMKMAEQAVRGVLVALMMEAAS
jgi:hypothetical protein